jgi:acetylornithine deacetylase/succinyl-diaminopimelate desuccinylase-like protein
VPATVDDPISRAVERIVARDVLPSLCEYIRIEALSPAFDPDWQRTGGIDRAVAHLAAYARSRSLEGMQVSIAQLEGRTPVLVCVIEPTRPGPTTSTLIYGHLDKQPPLGEWRTGLGPFTPVQEEDRLYGRGAADDGYALFAALTAIEALGASGGTHDRIVVLIEASEESGSPDLDTHLDRLAPVIGVPNLVICLDSGCVTYDRLWLTTSLRGLISGTLRIAVTREGVHSGHAGGIVPSPWRIARLLLDRIEDPRTGDVILPGLQSPVPAHRVAEMRVVAEDLGEMAAGVFPFLPGVEPEGDDALDRIARGTWHAAVAVTGQEGLPSIADAGNVALPGLALKLAVRIPPDIEAAHAAGVLADALTIDPPAGAHVTFELEQAVSGWDAPPLAPSISAALADSSAARFGRSSSSLGLGGSIPFLGTLGARFPLAQLVATGVLGPESNAHGPNEFLHLPTLRSLSATIADLLGGGA